MSRRTIEGDGQLIRDAAGRLLPWEQLEKSCIRRMLDNMVEINIKPRMCWESIERHLYQAGEKGLKGLAEIQKPLLLSAIIPVRTPQQE